MLHRLEHVNFHSFTVNEDVFTTRLSPCPNRNNSLTVISHITLIQRAKLLNIPLVNNIYRNDCVCIYKNN